MIQINQQRGFSKQSDYAAFAAVRVHNSVLKDLGGRNAWVFIQSPEGGVYRTILGSGSLVPFPEDAIELDYDTAVELEVPRMAPVNPQGRPEEQFYPCDLKIRPVRGLEIIKAHWSHPNPAYRIPLQISIISIILGGLGLLLGLAAFWF